GGAREYHRLDPVEQALLEDGRQIERHGGEGDVRGLPPAPLEPAYCGGTGSRRSQRRRETRGRGVEPPHDAPQLADQLGPPLRRVVARQPVGEHRGALRPSRKRVQQRVQLRAPSVVPPPVPEEPPAPPTRRR